MIGVSTIDGMIKRDRIIAENTDNKEDFVGRAYSCKLVDLNGDGKR